MMKKMILLLFFSFTYSFASMEFVVFEITQSPAFNYFFSFPVWIAILSIPMYLALTVFRHLK